MKIKVGTIKKDVTAYGNKYWIQIEDTYASDNKDLESAVDQTVSVVIGDLSAVDDVSELAVRNHIAQSDLKDMK